MREDFEALEKPGADARPDFEETLRALQDWNGGVPGPAIFYGLSDLDEAGLARVVPIWREFQSGRRASLLRHLTEAGESNVDLDYRALGTPALRDRAAAVRKAAIDLLWEDESRSVLQHLLLLARRDEALSVRIAAASALGRYVLACELGKLDSHRQSVLWDTLIAIWQNRSEDPELRRRALESLANSSADMVPQAIAEAWDSDDPELQASALYAMGRSCDGRWEETVLLALKSDDPALRYEAVRASGELELVDAVPLLAALVREDDVETSQAAIQALGEIGGPRAQRLLEQLAEDAGESDDDALQDAVEEALGNAAFGDLGLDFGPGP